MMNIMDSLFPSDISRKISEYYYTKSQLDQDDVEREVHEVFYRLYNIRSIFRDAKIITLVFKIPFCSGLLKLIESKDHPGWATNKFHHLRDNEIQNAIRNSPKKPGESENPEGHSGMYLRETDMIVDSHNQAGLITTSPMKFMVCPWCEICESSDLKFEDVWDGEKVLDICVKCIK
jgi:hypothetical protein